MGTPIIQQSPKRIFLSPVTVLIFANLLPLFGVLLGGWDVLTLLLTYWAESAIVGFYTCLTIGIVMFYRNRRALDSSEPIPDRKTVKGLVIVIAFFLCHYGLFMFGHLSVLLEIFTSGSGGNYSLLITHISFLSLLLLFVSHGYSFIVNVILNKEYERLNPGNVFFQPYRRIVLMHFTVFIGGFVYELLMLPAAMLFIFILIKIAFDVHAHKIKHRV